MTALTEAYIDEIANGRVPAKNSPERIAYEAEMMDGYDYTWAIQTFQEIRESASHGEFQDWDKATMAESK